MSERSIPAEASQLTVLQKRISTITWFTVLLLSIRGLYAFYGMKEKGLLEQSVTFITQPIVQLFDFPSINALDIPALTILFSAISILLVSYTAQLCIKYTEFRLSRARSYMLQRTLSVK